MSLHLFDELEAVEIVDEIVGKVRYVNHISQQAYKSIQDALMKSLERSRVVAPVVDPSRVIFRGTTFQMLLDGVRNHVGVDEHRKLFRTLGEEIGESFGHALIETLKQKKRLPTNQKTILAVWAIFDSSARWGDITVDLFDEKKKSGEIRISNNFLTSGYEQDRHRHCSFFEGYMMGVINQAFMEWGRWIKRSNPAFSRPLMCKSIMESPRKEDCVFNMKFKEEELTSACDKLIEAVEKHDNGRWEESIKSSRESLENALKDKIGWVNKKFDFAKALKAFEKVGVILPSSDQALRLYGLANGAMRHDDSHRITVFTRRFITEIEGISLTNEDKTDIKRAIRIARN